MDNDLMARRLRPPSQPSPQNSQPAQPSSPWDVPLIDDGSLAPAEPHQQDPPFAPPVLALPPSWPDPTARADVPWDRPAPEAWPPIEGAGADYSQTWQPEWPEADAVGDAAPWDTPAGDPTLDPDDAMAPVVGDVQAPAGVWHEWGADDSANGNPNGNGHYAASTPEPMTVTAHSDQPRGGDEPRPDAWADAQVGGSGPSLPEWPAEDDLTPPSSSRGPAMPESSPAPPDRTPDPPASPEGQTETPAPPASAEPVASPPAVTPIVTSAQIVPSPDGSPQNMVLRIEVAIVRGGPDDDVRAPEYNPRTDEGRAPMAEPEYEWGAPPPNEWQPAPAQPTQMDWGLPQLEAPQLDDPQLRGPQPGPPSPWSTPSQPQGPQSAIRPAAAPPPTWALTEPTPPYTPEPPRHMPPAARQYEQQQHQQPVGAQYQQPAGHSRDAYPPAQSVPSGQSAPAASSRARTGPANVAADQADLWFLSDQPSAPSAADDDVQPKGSSSSLLTAGLTVGFALLVIVLVLVFIQLMTSLLK